MGIHFWQNGSLNRMPGTKDPWVLPTTLYDEIGTRERNGRGKWDNKFGSRWVQEPPEENHSFMSLFSDMPDAYIQQQKMISGAEARANFGIAPRGPPVPPRLSLGHGEGHLPRRVISAASGKHGYTTRSSTKGSHRSSRRSERGTHRSSHLNDLRGELQAALHGIDQEIGMLKTPTPRTGRRHRAPVPLPPPPGSAAGTRVPGFSPIR